MFSIGAFAIIFDEQKQVLLCHRRDIDIWNLPGGRVESGELPTEAVIREAKEECGLDIAIDRLIGVYGKTDKDEFVFSFLCRVLGGRLVSTAEADEIRYFPVEHIPVNTSPKQVERIQDALSAGAQPIFRRQSSLSTRELLEQLSRSTGRR